MAETVRFSSPYTTWEDDWVPGRYVTKSNFKGRCATTSKPARKLVARFVNAHWFFAMMKIGPPSWVIKMTI